jgi:hypothetical protein
LEAGNSPTRASLYTVDFGTRRNRATSITVRISPSVDAAPSTTISVDAAIVLFMMDILSVFQQQNLSGNKKAQNTQSHVKRDVQVLSRLKADGRRLTAEG